MVAFFARCHNFIIQTIAIEIASTNYLCRSIRDSLGITTRDENDIELDTGHKKILPPSIKQTIEEIKTSVESIKNQL